MSNISPPDSPQSLVAQGRNVRRSYSVSRIAASPQSSNPYPPRRYASCPAHRCYPTAPTQYHTPLEDFPTSPLSWNHSVGYLSAPSAQSTSLSNSGNQNQPFTPGLADENQGKPPMSQMNGAHAGHHGMDSDPMQSESTYQQLHRLSLLTNTGSERASTLIGSDAEDEEVEREDGNPFDSVRTRVNEGTVPARVELLFDQQESAEVKYISPVLVSGTVQSSSSTNSEVAPHQGSSSMVKSKENSPKRSADEQDFDEDEDAEWDSDWGSPKRTRLERPNSISSHNFFLGDRLPSQNTMDSDTPYPKDEGASALWKSNNILQSEKQRGTGGSHSRSKSLPAKTAKYMASENWDDDFEDDGFSLGQGEVVVPQAIQDRQYKVILHLDSVREFAALVEKLKDLVERAILCGARWGATESLWDEAEAVIAIASTGTSDDEDDGGPRGRGIGIELRTRRNQGSRGLHGARHDPVQPSGNIGNETHHTTMPDRGLLSADTSTAPTNKSDPVAVAKMMMERMKRTSGVATSDPASETFQFDTKMLGPLLEKSRKLLHDLEDSIRANSIVSEGPSQERMEGLGDTDSTFRLDRGGDRKVEAL